MRNEGRQQDLNTPLTSASASANLQQGATQGPLRDKKQFFASGPAKVERVAEPSSRKSTGPRTPQGKQRSKYNALKHGLLSKAVLLEGESPVEYLSLLNGLRDDFQPQGKLESVLVENLAALLWRTRRLFHAENAEVSEKMEFTGAEFIAKRHVEAWDFSRSAITSDGLLRNSNNPLVVREAKEVLDMFRENFIQYGFREDSRLLKKLYGQDQDKGIPYGLRFLYEVYATINGAAGKSGDATSEDKLKAIMLAFIEAEIKRLTKIEKVLEAIDRRRIEYKTSAAVIPGQEALDRLVRYEVHLSREIDRILNRLERLQRMRKGQPLPLQLDVKIS
jgi:hypothetical protein